MTSFLNMAPPRNVGEPSLVLDQNALEYNIERLSSSLNGKMVRIATKSIRSLEMLKFIQNKLGEHYKGLMAYSLKEAIWLAENGFKDILIGYPQFDNNSLEKINSSTSLKSIITLMIDSSLHLDLLSAYRELRICIDLDMSLRLPILNFGVFRSSLKKVNELKFLSKEINRSPHHLVGLMGYEAQIAGVSDQFGLLTPLIKILKNLSKKKILSFRAEAKSIIGDLEFFNGGGTGSLFFTNEDDSIDELTIGSGFYCPTLFDGYDDLNLSPAIFFSLPVTRHPEDNIITCLGGGHVASGSVGVDKVPSPFHPKGLSLITNEMCGEVQTPLKSQKKLSFKIGDQVLFRPAKSGEICERFESIHAIDKNGESREFKTYRGDGKCFF